MGQVARAAIQRQLVCSRHGDIPIGMPSINGEDNISQCKNALGGVVDDG
jgi:hypothetical protein